MLVGEKEFMKVLKEEKPPCYAIVVKPKDVIIEKMKSVETPKGE